MDANARKVEDWGKTKFKPTPRSTQNPFTKPQNFSAEDHNAGGNVNNGFRGHNGRSGGNNYRGGRGRDGRGGRGGKFNNSGRGGRFKKDNNDRIKFNAIARDAKPETGTPWMNFKDEINHKLREERNAASQANMDTEEAKTVLKQREINYRRLLMDQKKQETTQWEDFGENKPQDGASSHNRKTKNKRSTTCDGKLNQKEKKSTEEYKPHISLDQEVVEEKHSNDKKEKKKKKQLILEVETDSNANTGKSTITNDSTAKKGKKKHTHVEIGEQHSDAGDVKAEGSAKKSKKELKQKDIKDTATSYKANCKKYAPIVSQEQLQDFDGSKLTFQQKDNLRKIITKGITFYRGTSLKQCLKNRRHQMALKPGNIKKHIQQNGHKK